MNILFITSDQQRADCYGFEGRKVKTPHLDMMAAEGTRFSACITPNLVCQPTRASILTGLLPGTHGVSDNGIDLPDATGEAGYAGGFSKAGFSTGYIGKAHFKTANTFQPTGTPECRAEPAAAGLDRALHGLPACRADGRGPQHQPAAEAAVRPALRALVLRRRPRRLEEQAADVEAARR